MPKNHAEHYLGTTAMRATAGSMALVSSVLGFEIVEIWSEGLNGKFHCTYVHADEGMMEKYPNIIAGHYPQHKKEHLLSPMLCTKAKRSQKRYHWRVVEEDLSVSTSCIYEQLSFPLRTEMSYQLENSCVEGNHGEAVRAYIVAFSTEKIQFKPYKLKFLAGLAVAIFVAAFDLDEDEQTAVHSREDEQELDDKKFAPMRPHNSSLNLAAMNSYCQELEYLHIGNDPTTMAAMRRKSIDETNNIMIPPQRRKSVDEDPYSTAIRRKSIPVTVEEDEYAISYELPSSKDNSTQNFTATNATSSTALAILDQMKMYKTYSNSNNQVSTTSTFEVGSLTEDVGLNLSENSHSNNNHNTSNNNNNNAQAANAVAMAIVRSIHEEVTRNRLRSSSSINGSSKMELSVLPAFVPTWEPPSSFSYPIGDIPIKHTIPCDLTIESFTDVRHIADGSNANIFLGRYGHDRVVIKMIKEQAENNAVAVQEFDLEHGTLARISHPHIIRILGAGNSPRRFIVLEWLGGGSLNTVLMENQQNTGLAQKFFRKPTFTYGNLLQKAKHMAEALDYLHSRCHSGATIIHRDLKPDNVGFTKDGTLKLFDFGLVTCVRARKTADEAYEMTGYTGSLRYMAPEVVLRKPYSEKADVYSYGIMLWQMARDRIPFKGFSKEEFINQVVHQHERPKLDKSWPMGFTNLLKACWDYDPKRRPNFEGVIFELSKLIAQENGTVFGGYYATGGGSGVNTSNNVAGNPVAMASPTNAQGVNPMMGAPPTTSKRPISTPQGKSWF